MFLRCFLYSLLVNLLLLANLEERFTYGELDCFLGVGDNVLEEDDLIDKAVRNVFALFWEAAVLKTKDILSCFQK